MIAGFIFLRLRGILGKKTGFEGNDTSKLKEVLNNVNIQTKEKINDKFDDYEQKEFLKGAKIAYETIITDFSDNDNKITNSKPLLNKKIFEQFDTALKERSERVICEITYRINSAKIKDHKKIGKILNVIAEFIAEVITCIRDKEKKIVSGDPENKKRHMGFFKSTTSTNPNWQLVNILR